MTALALHEQTPLLFGGTSAGHLVVDDLRCRAPVISVQAHHAPLRSLRQRGEDGLVTAGDDNVVRLWDSRTLRLVQSVPALDLLGLLQPSTAAGGAGGAGGPGVFSGSASGVANGVSASHAEVDVPSLELCATLMNTGATHTLLSVDVNASDGAVVIGDALGGVQVLTF